jgi:hypothetical protein
VVIFTTVTYWLATTVVFQSKSHRSVKTSRREGGEEFPVAPILFEAMLRRLPPSLEDHDAFKS